MRTLVKALVRPDGDHEIEQLVATVRESDGDGRRL